ncbi:hypothetical protein [Alicyclobacillus acidocaldarius]|uniref:Uncharacterized protein n=1 Tax=Alicyclobacillus acidocaldarius subsp. acidocaldarius (strain ATCC 27009 / DSM 446 / BCRC 14685 / JCM 5260 / KCTC 1825 / NBRC 15652 / NCIMB 11725 / NRRL B-14509 / 104-IA) TaxID=521098 RepID=C8WTH8_ALIAD|nr:hypothetical protein [Alicyclobacillus acidocaldarius]ACV57720.1 hypothetical protein Aaci_0672 [Alicyclobacillus acidocaldarius subsp. acidocaldarius DSM 446]
MIDPEVLRWAESVVEAMYADHAWLYERYGPRGRDKCLEDNLHHIRHLRTCYELRDTQFFTDYTLWLDGILRARGMETEHLLDNFLRMLDALGSFQSLDAEERQWYASCLQKGIERLRARQEG